jgi:hypothetical protein
MPPEENQTKGYEVSFKKSWGYRCRMMGAGIAYVNAKAGIRSGAERHER